MIAERSGLRIHEVAVDWVDDADSRVDIVATAVEDLRGIARLGCALTTGAVPLADPRRPPRGATARGVEGVPPTLPAQALRFAAIGVISTTGYGALYIALRTITSPQAANLVALLVTAVLNTAANRRVTFGIRGRTNAARSQMQGLVVFVIGLAVTSGALLMLNHLADHPGRTVEGAVLATANAIATITRFVLFRAWVFHPSRLDHTTRPQGDSEWHRSPSVRGWVDPNSVLDLAFGYNGLSRLSGSTGGPGGGFSGSPGLTRLFNTLMGGEISWLLRVRASRRRRRLER